MTDVYTFLLIRRRHNRHYTLTDIFWLTVAAAIYIPARYFIKKRFPDMEERIANIIATVIVFGVMFVIRIVFSGDG